MSYINNNYITLTELCKSIAEKEINLQNSLSSFIISGYPSLGKTTISNEISKTYGDRATRIESESWIHPLNVRKELKISGSNLRSYDISKSIIELKKFFSGDKVKFGEYCHEIGNMSGYKEFHLNGKDIIILDGTPFCETKYLQFANHIYCLVPENNKDWMDFAIKRDIEQRYFSREEAYDHNTFKLKDMKELLKDYEKTISYFIKCRIVNGNILYKLISNKS